MKILVLCCTLISTFLKAEDALPATPLVRPTIILVKGAAGEPEYGTKFQIQFECWQKAATAAGAEILTPSSSEQKLGETERMRFEKILSEVSKEGSASLWIVLIGHGTWDGKEARFNLEGPDVSGKDLATLLGPIKRPLTLINTSASSAAFLPLLAGPNRTIITATRSGSERNYARFGDNLALTLTDPAADYDQDGSVSVLEWFLRASSRTTEFYQSEGRLITEHALIDDNGDGKGTPAAWFRGVRATSRAKDNTAIDGATAQRTFLMPNAATQKMTPDQIALRDELEAGITALRTRKNDLKEEVYYQQLEDFLRKLALVYEFP